MVVSRLPVLMYPPQWNGSVNCNEAEFKNPNSYALQCKHCQPPLTLSRFGVSVPCSQNGGLNYVSCASCSKCCVCGNVHQQVELEEARWSVLIRPYINVAVTDEEMDCIMKDAEHKLRSFDPTSRMPAMHGLLKANDDPQLLKNLLEIGISYEDRYLPPAPNEEIPIELAGGYPVHFAAFYKRMKCLKILIQVGASVRVKNAAGQMPIEIMDDETMKSVLVGYHHMLLLHFRFSVLFIFFCRRKQQFVLQKLLET
jgi:hypothetical protein